MKARSKPAPNAADLVRQRAAHDAAAVATLAARAYDATSAILELTIAMDGFAGASHTLRCLAVHAKEAGRLARDRADRHAKALAEGSAAK